MRPTLTASLLLLCFTAAQTEAAELPQLFSHRAPLEVPVGQSGVVRVDLTTEVLSHVQSDFSDLRILAGDAKEIAFERVQPAPPLPTASVLSLAIQSADRRELPSQGREPPRFLETYVLHLPDTLPPRQTWTLEISSAQPEFVRRIDAGGGRRGSIFRLRQMAVERLTLELGALEPSTTLEVKLEGQGGGFLSPEFRLVSTPPLRGESTLTFEAPTEKRPFVRETVLSLRRPSGLQPTRVRLGTQSTLFSRPVNVFDIDPQGASRRIGSGRVFRAPTSEGSLEELELFVGPALGTQLELRIEDGDSAPLEAVTVTLVAPQPALVFSAAESQGRQLRLYFGGRRARAPAYDLSQLSHGDWRSTQSTARLGAIEANPGFRSEALLRPFVRAGAEADPRYFAQRFTVRLPRSAEGLSEITVAPEATAPLRDDLGDLRLVDAQRRQWPYLAEPREQTRELALPTPQSGDGWSEYPLPLPATPLWVSGVELLPSEHFFARHAELIVVDEDGHRTTLTAGQLVNNPLAQGMASSLRLQPPRPSRVHALLLRVEDRQEAPLQNLRARLEFRTPTLLTVAPEGDYEVLLGNPQAERPNYDLETARDLVRTVRPADAIEGPTEQNPAYQKGLALTQRPAAAKLAVWAVMLVAVIGLGALALKMARGDSKPDAGS